MVAFAFGYYFLELEKKREPKARPARQLRHPWRLKPAQILGVVGSLLLLLGLNVPTFAIDVGIICRLLSLHGTAIALLALASLLLAVKNHCVLLWLTGIGCQMAMAHSYLLWVWEVASTRPLELAPPAIHPPSGLLSGWWLMELGLLLLLVAAALGDLLAARQVRPAPLRSFLGPAENWQFYESP